MQIINLLKRSLSTINFFIFFALFVTSVRAGNALGDIFREEVLDNNMAVVSEKRPNCIIITNHRFDIVSNNVLVTTLSSFTDIDGKKISLKDLRIPCVAKITLYQNKKGPDSELISLEVKEYADNTSKHFTKIEPFARYPE
jgi:hypothetical protein